MLQRQRNSRCQLRCDNVCYPLDGRMRRQNHIRELSTAFPALPWAQGTVRCSWLQVRTQRGAPADSAHAAPDGGTWGLKHWPQPQGSHLDFLITWDTSAFCYLAPWRAGCACWHLHLAITGHVFMCGCFNTLLLQSG